MEHGYELQFACDPPAFVAVKCALCSGAAPIDKQVGREMGNVPHAMGPMERGTIKPIFLAEKRCQPQAHPGPSAVERIFNENTVQDADVADHSECAAGGLNGYD